MLTFEFHITFFVLKLFNINFQEIKAFYMRQNDDGKTVAAMDMLVPRVIYQVFLLFLLSFFSPGKNTK